MSTAAVPWCRRRCRCRRRPPSSSAPSSSPPPSQILSGHWKANGRMFNKIRSKILYKDLDSDSGDQRQRYMISRHRGDPRCLPLISRCSYRMFYMNFPKIGPVAFQWPVYVSLSLPVVETQIPQTSFGIPAIPNCLYIYIQLFTSHPMCRSKTTKSGLQSPRNEKSETKTVEKIALHSLIFLIRD